ncbi:MAG: hypothetical protein HZA46_23160 [Planctomycetales bacterium]|nr:hypothetical protein [Planctomycetales bacterium]
MRYKTLTHLIAILLPLVMMAGCGPAKDMPAPATATPLAPNSDSPGLTAPPPLKPLPQ